MTRPRGRAGLVLGLMSGTSVDGINVALVRLAPWGESAGRASAELQDFATLPFPPAVRAEVLRVAEGGAVSAGELSQLNFRLGHVFAEAALRACRKFRVRPHRIRLIGSHGQTVFHQGKPRSFLGERVASTLQIGEPAIIAAVTGITTVADFRPADMAAGGQGAPLVPWVDYLLYRDARRGRAALNIGGIANITVIPRAARPSDVFAFDTGPGNMVIDGLVRHFTSGKRRYDGDAQMASRGRLLPTLLNTLLSGAYFREPPPKTAGREQYGHTYLRKILAWRKGRGTKAEDLVRTATLLTPLSIVDAIHRWVLPRAAVTQLIVSGGGSRNPLIVAQLAAALRGIEIISADALGLPGEAKEAFAFALLANETMHGRSSNLPNATGAARPAILGKICYAPPR
jgi:anhydro-N-acetylmuramic acid kinase